MAHRKSSSDWQTSKKISAIVPRCSLVVRGVAEPNLASFAALLQKQPLLPSMAGDGMADHPLEPRCLVRLSYFGTLFFQMSSEALCEAPGGAGFL